jgi:hypothetical protein
MDPITLYCLVSAAFEAEFQLLLLEKQKLQTRTRIKLSKNALVDPSSSPFAKLYKDGSDSDFIAILSLDRTSFEELKNVFEVFYKADAGVWIPGGPGRPPAFHNDAAYALGLVLSFYRKSLELDSLCQLFGLPPSTCCRVLERAEIALAKTLDVLPESQINWPSFEQQVHWANLVNRKNGYINGRWGFIDGKNYKIQKPSSDDLQNAMYNGWLHSHLVTGTLCFG